MTLNFHLSPFSSDSTLNSHLFYHLPPPPDTGCWHSCYGQDQICKIRPLHYTVTVTCGTTSASGTHQAFRSQCPMHSFIHHMFIKDILCTKKTKLGYKKYKSGQINSSEKNPSLDVFLSSSFLASLLFPVHLLPSFHRISFLWYSPPSESGSTGNLGMNGCPSSDSMSLSV